jgi:hypothetical protein
MYSPIACCVKRIPFVPCYNIFGDAALCYVLLYPVVAAHGVVPSAIVTRGLYIACAPWHFMHSVGLLLPIRLLVALRIGTDNHVL